MGIKVKVVFNHLPNIYDRILAAGDKALDAHARTVADEARGRVHVESGATKASIYVSTPKGSTYGDAVSEAQARDPKAHMTPEEKPGRHGAVVGVADAAGVYEEYGTVHMAARPFLGPAHDAHITALEKAIADAIKDAL